MLQGGMSFLVLLLIPLCLAVGSFILFKTITWKEFLVQVGAQMVVAGISVGVMYWQNTDAVEIWNGRVTGKEQVRVSCSHSYQCNCRQVESCSGSGSSRSCTSHRVCDTCYEHSNDWDWRVFDSIGMSFNIQRVDRRGSKAPPRWTAVQRGEPTASRHHYTNYVKAAHGSLFNYEGQKDRYAKHLPTYPSSTHDYYRLNRLILVNGAKADNPRAWNARLSEINAELGHAKQVNMIVVLVRGLGSDYFYALKEAWLGANKNDVVLLIGTGAEHQPKWARVMAWTTNKELDVKLRDAIMDLPTVDLAGVMGTLESNVKSYYKRQPMADFEYLQASITPSMTQWIVTILLGILVGVGLTVLMHMQDLFGDDTERNRKFPFV